MGSHLFDLIEESKKIIGIPTTPDHGTREIAHHLHPFLKKLGFTVTFQTARDKRRAKDINLLGHLSLSGSKDLCPQGLLWVTHLDTVPSGENKLWTETGGDPFRATLKEDRLYGLGSADTKLDFLCKLEAINLVGLKNIKVPFALAGTFGEERALAGAILLKESGVVSPKWALVSEPSELKPVTAHKGILYMKAKYAPPPAFAKASAGKHPDLLPKGEKGITKMTFTGRAAHGATPHLGENAIEKAFRWLVAEKKKTPFLKLVSISGGTVHNIVPALCEVSVMPGSEPCPRIEFLGKFFGLLGECSAYLASHQNGLFDPPRTTCNVGVIRTEDDGIEIEFDFRLIPETDGEKLMKIFEKLPQICRGAFFTIVRTNPPMQTDRSSFVVGKVDAALSAVGLSVEHMSKSGNTEGAVFNAMGAESLVIGPGRSLGNIHQPNEYNEIFQLNKAVEFYAAFLKQFC